MPPKSSLLRQLLQQQAAPPAPKPNLAAQSDTQTPFGELSLFEKALDVIQRPLYASASAAKALVQGGNPFKEAMRGFAGETRTTYGDVLHAAGFREDAAKTAMSFAADVLLDPLTYVGVGEVGKAGTLVAHGVPRALSEAGVAALHGAEAAKSSQALRLLSRGAETGKVGLPRLSEERLAALMRSAARQAPELATDLEKVAPGVMSREKLAPEAILALRGKAGSEILGRGFGRGVMQRVVTQGEAGALPVSAAMKQALPAATREAATVPKTINFAGMPVVTTETAGKLAAAPFKAAGKVADQIPLVGPAVRAGTELVKRGAAALKAGFSTKTGNAVFDTLATAQRDLKNVKSVDAAEWWKTEIAEPIRKLFGHDPEKLRQAEAELSLSLEGINREVVRMEEPAAKAFIQKEVDDLTARLGKLAGKEAPFAAAEAGTKSAIKGFETLKSSGKLEEAAMTKLPALEPAIEKQAAKLTKEQAAQQLADLKSSDIIARIKKDWGKIYWSTAAGRNAEELTARGIPKDLIAAPKSGVGFPVDVVAEKYGMSSEELLDAVEKATAARKKVGEINPEAVAELKGSLVDEAFKKQLAADTAAVDAKIAKLQERLKKVTDDPERIQLQMQIQKLREDIEIKKSRAAGLPLIPVKAIERTAYQSPMEGIQQVTKKFQDRMEMLHKRESAMLAMPPEHREFYMPHYLEPEIKSAIIGIIRQDASKIMRGEFSGHLAEGLRRTQEGGVLEAKLQQLIDSGKIDPNKVRAELAQRGIHVSPTNMLVFEKNPIVAGLNRELHSIRAITAHEFTDEILNTPVFVKSKGNLKDVDDLKRLRQLVQENPDHAIFVPGRTYANFILSGAERESIRRGEDRFLNLLEEVFPQKLEEIAAKAPEGAKVDAYVIPREIAEHLSKAHQLPNAPEAVREFLEQFDKLQSYWKMSVTSVRLGFHTRNAISNLWQNFLAGVRNPQVYAKAAHIQIPEWRAAMSKIGRYTPEQVYEYARQFGVLRQGMIGSDVREFVERSVRPTGWTPQHGPLKGIPGAGALYPTGPVTRAGIAVGTTIEDNARLANFIDGLLKGMDPQSAAMRVKKYLFDYADLAPLEKTVLRRLMPFYTWTRKSIPLALEMLATKPGTVSLLPKARAEMEQNVGGLDRRYVADYINQGFGIPVRKNAKGELEYFLLKGFIPTADIANLDVQDLLGMLSPAIKEPIEQLTNTDLFRMKPISRFPGELVQFMGVPMRADLAHLLRNVLIMQQIDREVMRNESGPAKTIAGLFGLRTQTQNPVDQMRRFALNTQVEMGEMERSAERARARGENTVADQLEGRAFLLRARRDRAKGQATQLQPDAFRGRRKSAAAPKKQPTTLAGLKRQAHPKIDLQRLMKPAGASK